MTTTINEKKAMFIFENLPTGSGIDCSWKMSEITETKIEFKNSFHLMNDFGAYYAYADFTVSISIDGKWSEDFELSFDNDFSQKEADENMLGEYLQDLITWSLKTAEKYYNQ